MNNSSVLPLESSQLNEDVAIEHNVQRLNDLDLWYDIWHGKILSIDRKGLTQEKIAEKMGVSVQRVSKILDDDSNLTMKSVIRYALALGMAPHLAFEPMTEYAQRVLHGNHAMINASGRIEPCNTSATTVVNGVTAFLTITADMTALLIQRRTVLGDQGLSRNQDDSVRVPHSPIAA